MLLLILFNGILFIVVFVCVLVCFSKLMPNQESGPKRFAKVISRQR